MLIDEFLPVYDVSDSVAAVVAADVVTTWDALMDVDLMEVGRKRPLVGILGAIRSAPGLVTQPLHGRRPERPPRRMRLRDLANVPADVGRWVLLGARPGDEIAFGLVGKFWRPVIEFIEVRASEFRDFAQPGYAKTIYSLSVRSIDERHTLVSGAMRTATTDERARRWFRWYWTLGVGSGAHVLVNGVLAMTRSIAEERASGGEARRTTAA